MFDHELQSDFNFMNLNVSKMRKNYRAKNDVHAWQFVRMRSKCGDTGIGAANAVIHIMEKMSCNWQSVGDFSCAMCKITRIICGNNHFNRSCSVFKFQMRNHLNDSRQTDISIDHCECKYTHTHAEFGSAISYFLINTENWTIVFFLRKPDQIDELFWVKRAYANNNIE